MHTLKHITLLVGGSRGDIQPYIALGVALKKHDYEILFITNPNHIPFVSSFNLPCAALSLDMERDMKENPKLKNAMAEGNAKEFVSWIGSCFDKYAFDDCRAFLKIVEERGKPDLFVVGSLFMYYAVFASKILKIPVIKVKFQAIVYDPERPMWGMPPMQNTAQSYAVFRGILAGFYQGFQKYDNAMEALGQPRVGPVYSKENYIADVEKPPFGDIICQSPLFKDILYPGADEKNLVFVGGSILDATQQAEHSEFFGGDETKDLIDEFLAKDPERKPVYCGWGSMICKSPTFMTKFAVQTLQRCGQRGIILGGWAGLSIDLLRSSTSQSTEEAKDLEALIAYADENVLFVKEASHENLFPKMACTVHHGGAGTTNASLRAGVPTVVTPVFLDQYDHAHLVTSLGVGVGLKTQLQQTTVQDLADAITKSILDDNIRAKAAKMGDKLKQEDGANGAVKEIQKFWKEVVETGRYHAFLEEFHGPNEES